MQDNKNDKKQVNKQGPNEKPVRIPLPFKEALASLLQTKPPKDNDKTQSDKDDID